MEKATDIIKYANIDQIEQYMEHIEMKIYELGRKHQSDPGLELEHSILSKRFNELFDLYKNK